MNRDTGSIERIYRTHGHIVLRRARLLLGSDPEASEALQEIFTDLLRDPRKLDGIRSVVGWLYKTTTNHCLKRLRSRRNGERFEAEAAREAPVVANAQGEAIVEVRRLLALLPDETAAAVVYHHLDGMSHAEVAELLGCSRRKIGYLLERAQGLLEREEGAA